MPPSAKPVYLFGPFALKVSRRLLLRDHQVVKLTSRAFDTLLALVQNAGSILGKDELLSRVWPDTVVLESNLTQTVYMLRHALGERIKDHRYIVTVPQKGYCFVAEVRELSEASEDAQTEGPIRQLLGKRYSENTEVHQLCLKGRHFWAKRTAIAVEKAIRCFEQALDLKPLHAPAYAGLADSYAILSHYSRLSPKQTMPKAKAAALRAIEIDPALVEAHASLALIKMLFDWDWNGASEEFQKALQPDHHYPPAHHWHGMYLAARGQFDEAIREVERALHLDPLSLAINTDLGLVLYLARRFDEAARQYRATMDLEPEFSDARAGLLMASNQIGMFHQPISEFLRSPDTLSREIATRLENAYAQSGVKGYWLMYLELAEAPGSEVRPSPYVRARLHAEIGEESRALAWLERACDEHDGGLSLVKVDPALDCLRGAAQFTAIVDCVGLS